MKQALIEMKIEVWPWKNIKLWMKVNMSVLSTPWREHCLRCKTVRDRIMRNEPTTETKYNTRCLLLYELSSCNNMNRPWAYYIARVADVQHKRKKSLASLVFLNSCIWHIVCSGRVSFDARQDFIFFAFPNFFFFSFFNLWKICKEFWPHNSGFKKERQNFNAILSPCWKPARISYVSKLKSEPMNNVQSKM